MDYLVSSPIKTKWKLEASEFVARLMDRWPSAKVRRLTSDFNFSHAWEIEMPGGTLKGEFNPGLSGIAIDGDLGDCAALALWFRSLVPPAVPLLFYDDCFNVDVPLTHRTTAADLIAA